MQLQKLSGKEFSKAAAVGIGTAVLLSVISIAMFRMGISPMPKPPALAFAETILGADQPMPVGLAFHLVYVTFWSIVFVSLFRDNLSFKRALFLGLFLWAIALLVFFPIIGWGFLGLAISPKLIVAALFPHLIFSVLLWGLCRFVFKLAG